MSALTEPKALAPLTPADLAELISSFNEVTARLERTHESLRQEVARLQGELRDANDALQRSRRLAALGEMAAGIAHEVRNPLGSIRLYARMLETDLADRPPERALAGKIAAAVGGLDGIVGDVLSFARETRAEPEAVDAGDLLERALAACEADDRAHPGVSIVLRAKGPLVCDPILMHRALVNIIRNALQSMADCPAPEGGHQLVLEAGAAGAECWARIADTGPGVPPGVMDRMFNPFFTTRKAGTGLGLAIVHRIIDAHGGRITVRSGQNTPAGPGATFELTWPRTARAQPAIQPPDPGAPDAPPDSPKRRRRSTHEQRPDR
ncbi:MAG: ATP-binding protein [Phycisphaerales bacterium]